MAWGCCAAWGCFWPRPRGCFSRGGWAGFSAARWGSCCSAGFLPIWAMGRRPRRGRSSWEGFFSAGASGASPASAGAAAPSPSAGFFFQPPRFSSGVKFSQASLMQNGFLKPFPAFLNMVCPQAGQSSATGTSQVMKSHLLFSSLLVSRSQQ